VTADPDKCVEVLGDAVPVAAVPPLVLDINEFNTIANPLI